MPGSADAKKTTPWGGLVERSMTKFMWLAEKREYRPKVVRLEVVSETKCFATVKENGFGGRVYERRISKDGLYESFDEAKSALVQLAKNRVFAAESSLQRAKNDLKSINDMKKPVQ